uniref:DDE-1 domain-containing protein n=1 Tax=Erpetoichthys calabaricus TaxID=27687 RepID=A0A8C4T4I5_ERPCA
AGLEHFDSAARPAYASGYCVYDSQRQINKGTRRTYDMNFKIMVANEAERMNNMRASRKYGVPEVNVRLWRKDLTKYMNEGLKKLVKFVIEKRNEGFPISREVIKFKAMGWCKRMMKRNCLSLQRQTTLAQKLPGDFSENLLNFQRHIITLCKKHNYNLGNIGNADQTPVYFDMPSNFTVNKKGAKYSLIEVNWLRKVQNYCYASASRNHFSSPRKGWMTEELVLDWLNVIWGKQPSSLRNTRSMVVLDAFRGHLTSGVKEKIETLNSDLVIIPGGMTSQLQVLDVVVNKPFKDNLRKEYNNWLLAGNHPLTPTGKIKKPSASLLGKWVATPWQKIDPESIVKGFKKCCISNNLNGTEDDIL